MADAEEQPQQPNEVGEEQTTEETPAEATENREGDAQPHAESQEPSDSNQNNLGEADANNGETDDSPQEAAADEPATDNAAAVEEASKPQNEVIEEAAPAVEGEPTVEEPEGETKEVEPEIEQPKEATEATEPTEGSPSAPQESHMEEIPAPEENNKEQKPASPIQEKPPSPQQEIETVPQTIPTFDPPAETLIPEDAHATVKFVLMPSGQVATLRCNLSQTLGELKEYFAKELKIPPNMILLMFGGDNMTDKTTLAGLGVGPNGTVQLEMQSADPVNTPLKGFKPRQEYHMPDVITVRVETEDRTYKDVVVEIERATKKKRFIGGYRHKETSVEYHHASAQTMQKPPPPSAVQKFCRDTQTVQQHHMVQQTTNEMSTQMTGIGTYVSNMTDKLCIPGPYTTATQRAATVLSKVVVIQKYYRRWLAKQYVVKIRDDKQARLEWERQEELRKKKEKEDRIRKEFERRMNPKSKEDFDLLYHALENWRHEEVKHIDSTLTGAERKAALYALLEQETQLIASVGRHKIAAETENKDKRVQKFLEKAAAPKKWKGPDGKYTEMDTPYTIRAKELLEIYRSICMKFLTQDERLDVLLTLKHTVKEHDCKLTQEIIELIDREADLLMRGVKDSNLDGLRKRISTLFLQYIKTPTFNPEIARLLKVPQDPATLKKDIYFCSSCNQYLRSTEFQLSSNSKAVGKCRKCSKLDNEARGRQDYSHYRYMLKTLRRAEAMYGQESKIAFLLQENDLRYMVENIWNTQSALSAWDDLYDLVLVRWNNQEEWSPWNCILLTKEEASAHEKLEELEEGYGKNFIHSIRHKHTLARNYFSRLPGMAEHMREASSASMALPNGPSVQGQAVPVAAK